MENTVSHALAILRNLSNMALSFMALMYAIKIRTLEKAFHLKGLN
jgi:hypothetical protein